MGIGPELTERFQALVSHYLFEPCFARPGEGHDKGSVESRGKSIRLQHLTPVPRGSSLREISLAVLDDVEIAGGTKVQREGHRSQDLWLEEKQGLLPLPAAPFEARKTGLNIPDQIEP